MKLSGQIKPISYLKANAARIVLDLNAGSDPLVITQNGEPRVVVQDIRSYEKGLETLALLKVLALGNSQIKERKVIPAADAFKKLRDRLEKP
ncbi:MAG: type II toxin-antitoxin system Phd/YefM family antitoxin [Myxococcota bacterium]|jgi:prevent-host-death family protein